MSSNDYFSPSTLKRDIRYFLSSMMILMCCYLQTVEKKQKLVLPHPEGGGAEFDSLYGDRKLIHIRMIHQPLINM